MYNVLKPYTNRSFRIFLLQMIAKIKHIKLREYLNNVVVSPEHSTKWISEHST